jgi:transposase
LASRARIVLGCAQGGTDVAVAAALGVDRNTVGKWRRRYLASGLDGLLDEPRPGRPRTISDVAVEQVIVRTLETKPKHATHWSTRSMAAQVGLSQTAVSRIWRAFGLQPHRVDCLPI